MRQYISHPQYQSTPMKVLHIAANIYTHKIVWIWNKKCTSDVLLDKRASTFVQQFLWFLEWSCISLHQVGMLRGPLPYNVSLVSCKTNAPVHLSKCIRNFCIGLGAELCTERTICVQTKVYILWYIARQMRQYILYPRFAGGKSVITNNGTYNMVYCCHGLNEKWLSHMLLD